MEHKGEYESYSEDCSLQGGHEASLTNATSADDGQNQFPPLQGELASDNATVLQQATAPKTGNPLIASMMARQYTLSDLVVVCRDTPMQLVEPQNAIISFLRVIRHRMDPFVELSNSVQIQPAQGTTSTVKARRKQVIKPQDILLATLHQSDAATREQVFANLHVCNNPFPVLYRLPAETGGETPSAHEFFGEYLRNLSLVWRCGDAQRGEIQYVHSLGEDQSRPLIAAVRIGEPCTKSVLLNGVIGRNSFAERTTGSTSLFRDGLVELSWCPVGAIARDSFSSSQFAQEKEAPVFVLNVHGTFDKFPEQVRSLIEDATSVFLICMNAESWANETHRACLDEMIARLKKRSKRFVLWVRFDSEHQYESAEEPSADMIDSTVFSLMSDKESTFRSVGDRLLTQLFSSTLTRSALVAAESLMAEVEACVPALSSPINWKRTFFPLQYIFQQYADTHRNQYRVDTHEDPTRRQTRNLEFEQSMLRNRNTQAEILNDLVSNPKHPVFAFLQLAALSDSSARWRSFTQLSRLMNKCTKAERDAASAEYQLAAKQLDTLRTKKRDDAAKSESDNLQREIVKAEANVREKKWADDDSSLGLEHFWREIGQYYEVMTHGSHADQAKAWASKIPLLTSSTLPQLGARHLLDGFFLEIMDGNASHVPLQWVTAVFQQVHEILRAEGKPDRVAVVSILGLQSTGKSTLLNAMFGVDFPVSAGRCTRGVYARLVQIPTGSNTNGRLAADWVVVVDTEGLGGALDAGSDNRMAAFALAVSDICIVNAWGEMLSKEVRRVLLLAVNALADQHAVQLSRTHLLMVHHNVIAIDAWAKNSDTRIKMMGYLDERTEEACKLRGLGDLRFRDLVAFDPENHIFYLPPLSNSVGLVQVPNPRYGEAASKLVSTIMDILDPPESSPESIGVSLEAWGGRATTVEHPSKLQSAWEVILRANFFISLSSFSALRITLELDSFYRRLISQLTNGISPIHADAVAQIDATEGSLTRAHDTWRGRFRALRGPVAQEIAAFFHEKRNSPAYEKYRVDFTQDINRWCQRTEDSSLAKLKHVHDGRQLGKRIEALTLAAKDKVVARSNQQPISREDIEKELDDVVAKYHNPVKDAQTLVPEIAHQYLPQALQQASHVASNTLPHLSVELVKKSLAPATHKARFLGLFGSKPVDPAPCAAYILEQFKHLRARLSAEVAAKTSVAVDAAFDPSSVVAPFCQSAITGVAQIADSAQRDFGFIVSDELRFILIQTLILRELTPRVQRMMDSHFASHTVGGLLARNSKTRKPHVDAIFNAVQRVDQSLKAAEALATHLQKNFDKALLAYCASKLLPTVKNISWARTSSSLWHMVQLKSLLCLDRLEQQKQLNNKEHPCFSFIYERVSNPAHVTRKVLRELVEAAALKHQSIPTWKSALFTCIFDGFCGAIRALKSEKGPITLASVREKFEASGGGLEPTVTDALALNTELSGILPIEDRDEFEACFMRLFSRDWLSSSETQVDTTKVSDIITNTLSSELLSHSELCPFCSAFCHGAAGHSGYHHASHQPSAFAGWRDRDSSHLVTWDCTQLVSSEARFRVPGTEDTWEHYKNYRHHFEDWTIDPSDVTMILEPHLILARMRSHFAEWKKAVAPVVEGTPDIHSMYTFSEQLLKLSLSDEMNKIRDRVWKAEDVDRIEPVAPREEVH